MGGGVCDSQTWTSADLTNNNLEKLCLSDQSARLHNYGAKATITGGAGDQREARLDQSPAV